MSMQQQDWTGWQPEQQAAATAAKRASKKIIAIAAGLAAAAAATTIFMVTRSGDDAGSFCHDYQSLASVTGNSGLVDPTGTARSVPARLRILAGEAPHAAAADLRMLATDLDTLLRTGSGSVDDDTAQAAADRVDAIAERTCGMTPSQG